MALRVVFMGSPEFAVPSLRAVHELHHVALVVTQPDKPAGRGAQVTAPPVKQAALALGIPLSQPRSMRRPEAVEALAAVGADIAVVVAYGKLLPPSVLSLFPRGAINVHGSLLPAYRGAAPVQRAVIDGLGETGVSIMQLDEGMDTGPVFAATPVAIDDRETAGELMARLATLGASELVKVLAAIERGDAVARPQSAEGVSHAAMLTKQDGFIRFDQAAWRVAARIRGVDPWPGAVAVLRGQPVKLVAAAVGAATQAASGTVVAIDSQGLHVAAMDTVVCIGEIQASGRKRMSVAAFVQGRGVAVGDRLLPVAVEGAP
jgi:methionyl-tRNA formyltransferase